MKAKAKGARAERRTMALLEAAGYRCTKSGGSLGEWDVIGLSADDAVVVQVKCTRPPGRLEMEVLRDFRVPHNVRKLIHVWIDRKRLPNVIEL